MEKKKKKKNKLKKKKKTRTFLRTMPQWKEHRPSILRPKFAKNLELGFLFCLVLFCLNQTTTSFKSFTRSNYSVPKHQTIAEKQVPFEVPRGPELAERLASVLEVIYLVFNEGYTATAGDDWMRPALCEDALRLGRILAELMPHEPEVHGLIALMEIQASRARARLGPSGEPILLLDQDRARWDGLLIQR